MAVLGLAGLDTDSLTQRIAEIQVPEHNRLVYVSTDGHVDIVDWKNPSRRESWTEEMKQAARERQNSIMERRKKNE